MSIGRKNANYSGPSFPLTIRQPKALPATQNFQQLLSVLKAQQNKIALLAKSPAVPPIVNTFIATALSRAIQLQWNVINTPGIDGFILLKSSSPAFNANVVTIPLRTPTQTSYIDPVGATQTFYYRIQVTSGTPSQPQSVVGPMSPIAGATSLA